jgi:two-component system cell cycle sensor histidine kinase/response regulator CckA
LIYCIRFETRPIIGGSGNGRESVAQQPTYEDLKKKISELEKEVGDLKAVSESLRKSEEKYRRVLNGMEEEYYEVDLAGNFTFFNEVTCRNHGYPPDELMGMNYRAYMSPEVANKIYKIFIEVYRTGISAKTVDYEVIRKDGSKRINEMSVSLLRDETGAPIGFSGISRDRTELIQTEQALREREESYRSILELAPDSISISRVSDGRYMQVNDAFCQRTGYSPAEAIGRTPSELNLYADPADRIRMLESLKRDGQVEGLEIPFRIRDGTIQNNLVSARPIHFKGEDCLLAVSTNITSLKAAQKSLAEGEESYRSVLALAPDAILIAREKDGRYVQVNDAFCQMTGYNPEEAIGRTGLDLNLYPDPAERDRLLDAMRRDGRLDGLEIRFQAKDGAIMHHLVSARPIRFKGEQCVLVMATVITPIKEAERALRESEEKYRNILESMEEGYWEVDLEGKFTYFNDAFWKLSGCPPRDMLMGMNYLQYTSSREEAERIYRIFVGVYRTGAPAEVPDFEVNTSDGTPLTIEMSVSLLRNGSGVPIGFRGISRDRTQQRKAEKALRESEEKYRNILESMEEGYWECDLAGNFTFLNEAICRIQGYPRDELMGMNNRTYSSPHEAKRIYGIFKEVYRTGVSAKVFDYEIIVKDGDKRIIELSASLLRNGSGDPIGFRGITRDVTEKRMAERALRESEEKYRLLVENASEAIYITQDGMVKFPNPRTMALTGYSADELAQMPFLSLVHPKDRDEVREPQDGETEWECGPGTFSFRIHSKQCETLWVELTALAITWEGRPATLNFLRDVTPQKRMEVQLLQARKMEAIGTLAGGIAHDFNNLLMGIQGNTSLMLLDVATGHPHYQNLKSIEKMVQHGSGLTKQLLGVARGGKYEVKTTDLNQLIEAGADLFGRTRKEISIHRRLQENLWPVEVDGGQIEQVLLNLYVNAWHAMPEGGELYIETKNLILDQEKMTPYGLKSGRFVRVSVTDTGIGMDETTLKRVFDPFFTTKEMGRGTGLGLASAYGIIRNHNGIINVYSEKGEGTTFNIYLPASDKQIQEKTVSVEAILKGTETILFVDDEEAILQIGKQILERLGYHVVEATSGPEAIEILQKDRERFHLVILDMIMPGMSGGETYDHLRKIDPNVKVLLSSGYSINGQAKKILERGCKGFIQKPYNLRDLSKRVRQILDR